MSSTVIARVAALAFRAASPRTPDNERRVPAERRRETAGRAVLRATALVGGLAAVRCGGDPLGNDCVTDGVVRMGREQLTSISVACALPAESWIVAFPRDVGPGDLSPLPQKYRAIVADSAAKGYNWCVGDVQLRPDGKGVLRALTAQPD